MFNWAAFAAITSLFSVVVILISASYTHGKLTQRVDNNEEKAEEHAATLEKHGSKLEKHGEDIGRLQEWKNGFNAAARVSGSKEVQ